MFVTVPFKDNAIKLSLEFESFTIQCPGVVAGFGRHRSTPEPHHKGIGFLGVDMMRGKNPRLGLGRTRGHDLGTWNPC